MSAVTEGREAPSMSINPFSEKPTGKKHIITVSLTAEQDAAFDALKARTNTATDGAMIKKALEYYVEWLDSEER